MCVLLCEHDIACALRWGVTLVGVYSSELYSPRHETPFQVQGVCRETPLTRDHDFEGSQDVALINIFVNYIKTSQF